MLTPGRTVVLDIEKPAAGGRMIARADGQVVLVSGVIPGERAAVRIERVGKGVAYGEAVSIENRSPDRVEPRGDPFCGGCVYRHVAYQRQLTIKAELIADALIRIGKIAWPHVLPVLPSPIDGYRMRARLHIRERRLGFFREGTHDICDARKTGQLLPATCDVLEELLARLNAHGLQGGVELDVSENVDATERVVHLELQNATDAARLSHLPLPQGLTGATMGRSAPSRLPGTVISGSPHVTDVVSLDGRAVSLRRHVLAFFQGNRFLLGSLVKHVVGQIAAGEEVIDLYAGTGLFSIAAAAARGARVTAVEGDHVAASDLAANAAPFGALIEPVHEAVETFVAHRHPRTGTIIVDPPRIGMSKESLLGAIHVGAPQLVYVSCDVATLARDSRKLLDAGYALRRLDAFDLFPNTPHVETVAVFSGS